MADDDLRAVRRLGQIMAEQKATVGLAKGAQGIGTSAGYKETRTPEAAPTLAEAGIDKTEALSVDEVAYGESAENQCCNGCDLQPPISK